MNIVLDRKVPFKISLVFATLDTASHAAFVDLTANEKDMINNDLQLFMSMVEKMMTRRRVELGKDRG